MKTFLLGLLIVLFTVPALSAERTESAYDRVVRTKTLRCAYTSNASASAPDSGKEFSDMFSELLTEMAQQLGLKIEWVKEVSYDALSAGFQAGRYDAVCGGYSEMPSRAWSSDFTKPFVFSPFVMYVRATETRFKDLNDLNKNGISIATLDGEMSQIVVRSDFPMAQEKPFSGLAAATDRLEMVATGKADATPMESAIAEEYTAKNPGKIKQLGGLLRMEGSTILIPHNEFALKNMLDTAIDAMLWNGVIEKIVKKHEKYPGTVLVPAPAYQPAPVAGEK
ncbi:MAG: transporter substrate-binding domain-containing protein [Proteobacteria bacterium]|nr:transporter substrate-binding domain-containing protein [Pseudomonadota bacterium]